MQRWQGACTVTWDEFDMHAVHHYRNTRETEIPKCQVCRADIRDFSSPRTPTAPRTAGLVPYPRFCGRPASTASSSQWRNYPRGERVPWCWRTGSEKSEGRFISSSAKTSHYKALCGVPLLLLYTNDLHSQTVIARTRILKHIL